MPEYLAPGVYVEETSFRSKSIEGVSTTTTGFVGPARYGPLDIEPDLLTSLEDFERIYGDGQPLVFTDNSTLTNYLWHAVRAFFVEGGKRLYVARVFRAGADDDDGVASYSLPAADGSPDSERAIGVRARFPGAAGNRRVRFTLRLGENSLSGDAGSVSAGGLQQNDIVLISDSASPFDSPPGEGTFYRANWDRDEQTWVFSRSDEKTDSDWRLNPAAGSNFPALDPARGHSLRLVTLTVTVINADGSELVWSDLPLDPQHTRNGAPDSVFALFAEEPATRSQARSIPIVISTGDSANGLDLIDALLAANDGLLAALFHLESGDTERSVEVLLDGGNDGVRPQAGDYEGEVDPNTNVKTGLRALEDLEDISIVAAPGSTAGYGADSGKLGFAVIGYLIAHATRMRYRIAVLDSGDDMGLTEVRELRAKIDSKYAALYYPWVRILDPITNQEINLPPSGFVAGIYARNDVERGVYKAPANEVVNLAIGFEKLINKAQQDVLNPLGINCFRFFEGRGFRLWGARTVSSDPEWKYVNLRRYFAYLERSIDIGTQWAVFEPNGDALWANVRRTVSDFLFNEWQSGALLGEKPEKAFFVRCDRSTMTQNDLDNGRLICLIGVAPLRPAEFVIFRIGQWTADHKV